MYAELTSGKMELVPCCDRAGKVTIRPLQRSCVQSSGVAGAHGALVSARNQSDHESLKYVKVRFNGSLCGQNGEGLCDLLVVDSHLVHELFNLDLFGVELLEDRCFIQYIWDVARMLGSTLCECVEVNVVHGCCKSGHVRLGGHRR